jgi:hypothetical protein
VLKHLTERQRTEIMLRIATLEGIQPTALKDLNEVLFKVLAGGDKIRKTSLGGVKTAAEIINLLGAAVETPLIEQYIGDGSILLCQMPLLEKARLAPAAGQIVQNMLEYLAGGDTAEDLLREFPDLEPEDIQACLTFAARSLNLHSVHLAVA